MPTVEERVAYLEGRLEDHTAATTDLRTTLSEFRDHTYRQFSDVRAEIGGLRQEMHSGFAEVRQETNTLRAEMNRRFEQMNEKVDRHFTWLVGIQVASLVAMVGGLVGAYFK